MPKYTAEESQPFELIPEGTILAAKVKSIEEVSEYGGKPLKFPKLDWKFEVTEAGPWEDYTVRGSTSQKFTLHEKAKLTNWSATLLGRMFEVGEGLDTDDLIGLPCRILIEHQQDKDDPERMWMRVGEVMPPRNAKSAEDVFG